MPLLKIQILLRMASFLPALWSEREKALPISVNFSISLEPDTTAWYKKPLPISERMTIFFRE